MVIKETILHSGWSYGNGDDQYDNESVGSTRTVFRLKKSMENSSRNKKNGQNELIGSRNNDEHTDENGWTKIGIKSNRKPKTKNAKQTSIDSVITTINVDPEIVQKGAPRAKIDSPIRNNRCTISDDTNDKEGKTKGTTKKEEENKQIQATSKEEEIRIKTEGESKTTEIAETNRCETRTDNTSAKEDTRNNNRQENEDMHKKNDYEKKYVLRGTGIGEEHKDTSEMANTSEGSSNDGQKESNKESNKNNDKNKKNTENNNDKDKKNTAREGSDKNNTNEGGNKVRVNILVPEDMNTYAFTVSWRPDQKKGQDGKVIIRMLMREMAHRTPSIIFHPSNSSTSPVPRDINNINNDFPRTPASYDDFFDQMINRDNTNQRTFMKVTMPHNEKELQKKLNNYLFHNKIYMNSPYIDDNTLEQVGFIENGHSRLVYRPTLEMKIRNGLKEVMEGELLTSQQIAQLKQLTTPIRVECHRGTVRAGSNQNQIVCEGIVLKTVKSQSKIAMELLSMLPDTILGEHYRVIPKSLSNILGYEIYGQVVADTVNFQNKLRPITILYCHPSVFDDHYDSIKIETSTKVRVDKFIKDCCGAISIEETNETKEKGKYIVVLPEEKVESARVAIGKMFQEFQTSSGRATALACLKAYENLPLVNDNVTISGHAQKLSEKIRDRYRNRPKTTYNQTSSPSYSYHGSTAIHEQNTAHTTTTAVPRSIIRKGKNQNITTQQWPQSPIIQQQQQQQQQRTPTHQVEERTVMSNLSPDDSAKTMMTNVSRMVETLGTVVHSMAKENSNMAKETANTNETIKQMMIQQTETNKQMMLHQTTTMNNFMMLMTRNEERRQEVPIREIQPIREILQTSTPTSTITNSQFSLSQRSSSANKRKIEGIADDETTAASTLAGTDQVNEDDDIEAMLEEQDDAIEETRTEEEETMDVTMTDEEQPTRNTSQQQQETTTISKTTALVEGDFDHQFSTNTKQNDKTGRNTPATGVNQQ
jgi:hypothetical protein